MDSLNLQSKSGPSDRACKALNIVTLIENNPIIRLNGDYQSKLVNKIKNNFTDTQQQLFVSSFYCYLNYDQASDFVVKLNDVWKWIGFSRIDHAKTLLEKHFVKDIDYIVEILISEVEGIKYGGDRKSETITMTIKTFKKFCMKARTSKADEIHDYYIKMEEIINEVVNEESDELRIKLQNESSELRNKLRINNDENEKILLNNSSNKKLVYLGLVGDDIAKFGYSKGIEQRVLYHHKKDFPSFVLKYTIHTEYHVELEESIKNSCRNGVLSGRRFNKVYNDKNQTELIQLDEEFTIEDLYNEIIKLNEIIINDKKLGCNGTILKYKEKIENQNAEIIELKKCLSDNGIELPKICGEYQVKTTDNNLEKYYLLFLENFVKDKNGIVKIITSELYQQYLDFIELESAELYSHCYSPFCRELSKCKHMTTIRVKVDGDKVDNRTRGKKIDIELLSDWIKEKWNNFNNVVTSKVKKRITPKVLSVLTTPLPINNLENKKIQSLFLFLKDVVDNSSENVFKIPNTELYNNYRSFSKLNDFSMNNFGKHILKCPGITPIKSKIWFKKFNKHLCQEWLLIQKT